MQLAAAVHLAGGGQGAFGGQCPAGADAAVKLVEIGLRPAVEQLLVIFDHLGHHGVRLAIETAIEQLCRIDEELIDGHSQPLGKPVERAGVRLLVAAENAANRADVQAGLPGHTGHRQPSGGHQTQQVFAGMNRHSRPLTQIWTYVY